MDRIISIVNRKNPSSVKVAVFFKHAVGASVHNVDFFSFQISGKRKIMPWSYTKEHDNAYVVEVSGE